MRFYSPLRYPGGKTKLLKEIVALFEENDYKDGIYVEPFAGGAGLALSLLAEGYVKKIHLNDLDNSIYSFWQSLMCEGYELIRMIESVDVSMEEWYKQKAIQEQVDNVSTLELGFSTFFLNRTNVSGIIKGGVIGGYNQEGKYKIDARFNKKTLIKRIEKIINMRDKIEVTNHCVVDLLDNDILVSETRKFIYFDPPYYIKGPELYQNHLEHKDHIRIAEEIKKINDDYWIVTYDNVDEIKKIYSGYKTKEYSLNYSAGNTRQGSEVMIFSDNLITKSVSI